MAEIEIMYDLGMVGNIHIFGDSDGNVHFIDLIQPKTYARVDRGVRLVRPKPDDWMINSDDKPVLVELEKEIVLLDRYAYKDEMSMNLVGYSKMLKCWIKGK
jgi:hypothetical protein